MEKADTNYRFNSDSFKDQKLKKIFYNFIEIKGNPLKVLPNCLPKNVLRSNITVHNIPQFSV
jgi:hypothetical protein